MTTDRPDTRSRDDLRPTPAAILAGRAVASLTFGAAGLFLFNIVFGPIAIVLGVIALRRNESGAVGRVAAWAGIVLGIADLVVFGALLAAHVHGGSIGIPVG